MTARNRLSQGYFNGAPYNEASNPGGLDGDGHRLNLVPASGPGIASARPTLAGDMAAVGAEVAALADAAAASVAAAQQQADRATALAGTAITGRSASSLSLPLSAGNTISLPVEAGRAFVPGMEIVLVPWSSPTASEVRARVTSYTASSGAMSAVVLSSIGTGTWGDWSVRVAGPNIAGGAVDVLLLPEFPGTGWSISNTTAVRNAAGTTDDAWTVTTSVAGASIWRGMGVTPGGGMTMAAIVRQGSTPFLRLDISDFASVWMMAGFNLSTGETSISGMTWTNRSAGMRRLTGDWWLVWLTGTAPAAATSTNIQLRPADGLNGQSQPGLSVIVDALSFHAGGAPTGTAARRLSWSNVAARHLRVSVAAPDRALVLPAASSVAAGQFGTVTNTSGQVVQLRDAALDLVGAVLPGGSVELLVAADGTWAGRGDGWMPGAVTGVVDLTVGSAVTAFAVSDGLALLAYLNTSSQLCARAVTWGRTAPLTVGPEVLVSTWSTGGGRWTLHVLDATRVVALITRDVNQDSLAVALQWTGTLLTAGAALNLGAVNYHLRGYRAALTVGTRMFIAWQNISPDSQTAYTVLDVEGVTVAAPASATVSWGTATTASLSFIGLYLVNATRVYLLMRNSASTRTEVTAFNIVPGTPSTATPSTRLDLPGIYVEANDAAVLRRAEQVHGLVGRDTATGNGWSLCVVNFTTGTPVLSGAVSAIIAPPSGQANMDSTNLGLHLGDDRYLFVTSNSSTLDSHATVAAITTSGALTVGSPFHFLSAQSAGLVRVLRQPRSPAGGVYVVMADTSRNNLAVLELLFSGTSVSAGSSRVLIPRVMSSPLPQVAEFSPTSFILSWAVTSPGPGSDWVRVHLEPSGAFRTEDARGEAGAWMFANSPFTVFGGGQRWVVTQSILRSPSFSYLSPSRPVAWGIRDPRLAGVSAGLAANGGDVSLWVASAGSTSASYPLRFGLRVWVVQAGKEWWAS